MTKLMLSTIALAFVAGSALADPGCQPEAHGTDGRGFGGAAKGGGIGGHASGDDRGP